ncbi:MAG: glycosyltransferase, partial [Clostridia bacterium]|nr:glycosyltransferase [Clostridia bacterium]
DGSTDNSPGICDKAAEVHHNITVIHKENGGVSSARNAGLDIATGKYISFIDSDDYVEPDMMELMVGRAEADGSQLVQCDITRHIKSEVKNNFFNVKNGNLDLKNHNLNEFNQIFGSDISVFLWDKIYERSIIENHKIRYLDMKYVLSEDQLFLICYCRFANQISFVDKALYHYDIREVSLSRGAIKMNILNQWTNYVVETKKFMDANDPDCADQTTYNTMIWDRFCNACWHLQSKENFYQSMESVSPDNKKLLKKSFFSVAFGRTGSNVAKNKKLDFKAQLRLRFTAFLLLIGKYEFPLRTYLQP